MHVCGGEGSVEETHSRGCERRSPVEGSPRTLGGRGERWQHKHASAPASASRVRPRVARVASAPWEAMVATGRAKLAEAATDVVVAAAREVAALVVVVAAARGAAALVVVVASVGVAMAAAAKAREATVAAVVRVKAVAAWAVEVEGEGTLAVVTVGGTRPAPRGGQIGGAWRGRILRRRATRTVPAHQSPH